MTVAERTCASGDAATTSSAMPSALVSTLRTSCMTSASSSPTSSCCIDRGASRTRSWTSIPCLQWSEWTRWCSQTPPPTHATGKPAPKLMVLSVVMWEMAAECVAWFLCYPKEVREDGDIVVEHLERMYKESDKLWRHPVVDDVQVARPGQLVQCSVEGEWSHAYPPAIWFTATNCESIYCQRFRCHCLDNGTLRVN